MNHTSSSTTSNSLYTYSPQASPTVKSPPDAATTETRALARHTTTAYERIRTVGKGSFGIAVLYRRKEDDSFVILKEINLHELSPSERNMSLNEVSLLSRLDHPHIIHYFDSFEEDGTLMIEMEYADGGTLAQLLAHRERPMPEAEVTDMFEQITSAVSYLHDNNILHRDLKTANIFLTKERMVKVGDFGISKRMGTETNLRGGAQTILGTPYYLSPEMCEGKTYNEKSDMWALGCCLYEMCTLRKAFDADNLPVLIRKIVNSEYEPVKGPFSQDVRLLVRDLLRTDPEQRPSAAHLLEQIRRKNPLLDSSRRAAKKSLAVASDASAALSGTGYSALYRFDVDRLSMLAMAELPNRIQIKQITLSTSHQLALTVDERVYSWGDNTHGQLGHGDRRVRTVPTLVDALQGKGVSRLAAGKHFSLFCAGRGIAMASGHRQFVGGGQSGNGEDWLKPKIIEALLKEDIVEVSCGEQHAAVLTEGGGVFVWGVGENGRLGTGIVTQVFMPTRIQIPTRQLINSVVCGPNSTMLITNSGTVLAMGSNLDNKLNLNQRPGFFANAKNVGGQKWGQVENVLTPTAVKPFPSRVVSASLGLWHSGVLLENGHVHLFGNNNNGELGIGNCTPLPAGCTCPVKGLMAKACVHLVCGDGFTMVGTVDNELYSWGWGKAAAAETTLSPSGSASSLVSLASFAADASGKSATEVQKAQKKKPKKKSKQEQQQQQQQQMVPPRFEVSKTREGQLIRVTNSTVVTGPVLQPRLVLRLAISQVAGASGGDDPPPDAGNASALPAERSFLALSALVCAGKRVFCMVDVTQPKKGVKSTLLSRRRRSAPDTKAVTAQDAEPEDHTWIRRELAQAEFIPYRKVDSKGQQQLRSANLLRSEQRLREEIALLRGQLQEHKSTCHGHERQMTQLQGKMAELQALLKRHHSSTDLIPVDEPPPAYASLAKVSVVRNSLFPEEVQHHSRSCAIL